MYVEAEDVRDPLIIGPIIFFSIITIEIRKSIQKYFSQCRLIQWARRARAPKPQGPQTADALIFPSREISVTNCVLFTG